MRQAPPRGRVLRLRRGTTTKHITFTGKLAEITVDITKHTVVVHDGETPGGFPLALEGSGGGGGGPVADGDYGDVLVSGSGTVWTVQGFSASSHTHGEGDVTGLTADLADLASDIADVASDVAAVSAALAGYQPLDADLTALAASASTAGLVERTGAATYSTRLLGTGASTSVPTLADADARYAAIGDIAGLVRVDDFFGTGIDGDVTISADTALSRIMHYENLTINNGITLTPNRYPFYVRGTLTNNGTIAQDGGHAPGGNNAAGGVGGGTTATGTLLGVGQTGQNGSNQNNVAHSDLANQPPGMTSVQCEGGNGGAGHTTGASTTGGTAGNLTTSPTVGSIYTLDAARIGLFSHATTLVAGSGGGAGGGGTNSGVSGQNGGGGGGGGGVVAFLAKEVVNNGNIRALGGNGGNGGNDTAGGVKGTGGGGGGGGGKIIVGYHTWTGASPDVSPGQPGAGQGTGIAGIIGNAGLVVEWVL